MNYSYFVGLDVGKKSFDASLMSSDEEELGHRRFANSESGIHSLLDWVSSRVTTLDRALFCAENMGSYVTSLCLCSQQLGFSLALECPWPLRNQSVYSVERMTGLMLLESLHMQCRVTGN